MPPDRRKKIIINADDFGFSPAVNEAVVSAAERGVVRAASLMVTMPFDEDAAVMTMSRCPELEIGLHFSLTCGKAISPPDAVPLLVDAEGIFRLGFVGLVRLVHSKRREQAAAQIRRELQAQLARIDELRQKHAFRLNHLDSHQHVHVLPEIFEALETESRERKLHLRIPHESLGGLRRLLPRLPRWIAGGLPKRAILNGNLNREAGRPVSPIGYFGILDSGKMDATAMRGIFRAIEADDSGTAYFEINTHPSMPAENRRIPAVIDSVIGPGDRRFHSSNWREREWQTLMDNSAFPMSEQNQLIFSGFPD